MMIATRTYLVMTSRDRFRPAAEALPDVRVESLEACPPALFRHFYEEVGRRYHWIDRLGWSDDEIRAYLARPEISFWVLYVGDAPAGYFELRRDATRSGALGDPAERYERGAGDPASDEPNSVEIAYFGLLPAFIGRGLGKYLLSVAVERAWALGPRRVWLHTSTLDHPAALANYLARGFEVDRREEYEIEERAR